MLWMLRLLSSKQQRGFLYPFLLNFSPCDTNHQFSFFAERHFQRLSRLLQASMFIDFMWQNMKLSDVSQQEDMILWLFPHQLLFPDRSLNCFPTRYSNWNTLYFIISFFFLIEFLKQDHCSVSLGFNRRKDLFLWASCGFPLYFHGLDFEPWAIGVLSLEKRQNLAVRELSLQWL